MAVRAKVKTLPAPIGGLNTRDSLTEMPKEDAVILTNWEPKETSVQLRKGYSSHATGMGGTVETIAEYNSGSNRKLIACANSQIWNASGSGAASSLSSGYTSNRWQWVNFNAYLIMVNGADTPVTYDGVTTVAASTISGPTVTSLIGIHVHKSRVYTWQSNSSSFWYGATNAIGGAFTEFPLTRVSKKGGTLTAMGTITHDAGSGPDDFAVFLMSSGEAIVYQGSDPGTADSWSLVGIYDIASPLSIRGVAKIGGDLVVITREDYMFLSQEIGKRETRRRTKAVGALQEAVRSYSSNYGWQCVVHPSSSKAIFNIPKSGNEYDQHVLNIVTGAWCKYTGIPAVCWGVYNNELYFGGAGGIVYKADTGTSDNNTAINADALPAWSMLGSSNNKQLTAYRNLMTIGLDSVNVSTAVGIDFDVPNTTYTETVDTPAATPWGSPWGSPWSQEDTVYNDWKSENTFGRYFAQRVKISTGTTAVEWHSSDYVFQIGGLI
jgi:hypothetical protein